MPHRTMLRKTRDGQQNKRSERGGNNPELLLGFS